MDDLFFYGAKLLWKLASPDHFLLLLMTLGVALTFSSRWFRLGRNTALLVIFLAWTIALLPIAGWMREPLENQFVTNPQLPAKIDGILVLGGSIQPRLSQRWQQLQTNNTQERITYFVALANRYPDARLVFTGGSASLHRDDPTEAKILQQQLAVLGLEPTRVEFEKQSRNTYENAKFTKQLVQPDANENWILITSAYHMPRSIGVFCKQDWRLIPYPVDHTSLAGLPIRITPNLSGRLKAITEVSHEWLGLFMYYLTGKTDALIPSNCDNPN